MKPIVSMFLVVMTASVSPAQSDHRVALVYTTPAPSPGSQDDPAFHAYREGYNRILSEEWVEARERFADLLARFPKSDYVDDARYWSAYALRYNDRKKAIEEYKKFIEAFPRSNYYDDAVADLGQLESGAIGIAPGGGVMLLPAPKPAPTVHAIARVPHMNLLRRELRSHQRQMRQFRLAPGTRAPSPLSSPDDLDADTELRLDALYALGEGKEDGKAFNTLRDVAVDRSQPPVLREAALDVLTEFKKHDLLPTLVDIARTDTSEDLQSYAIELIGTRAEDKNTAVETLIDLFRSTPGDRKEPVQTIFYSIAEVGNDKAVEFLRGVALHHQDHDLRREAVYYLGNIGGENARSALYEILEGKK